MTVQLDQPAIEPGSLLTMRDVGKRLRLCERSVYGLIRRGELPAVRIGGSVRIDPADLADFIARSRVVTKGAASE
jgi:putative molybdopterin biosynthesis protein